MLPTLQNPDQGYDGRLSDIGKLPHLQSLTLRGFSDKDCWLPDCIGKLASLQALTLDCSGLESLTGSIARLSRLQHLVLQGGKGEDERWLQPLEKVISLSSLTLQNLTNLTALRYQRCAAQYLPGAFAASSMLQRLDVRTCTTLQVLNVSACTQLSLLDFSGCGKLSHIKVSSSCLKGIPGQLSTAFDGVTGLQQLDLSGCSSLTGLPGSIFNLRTLVNLQLADCSSLGAGVKLSDISSLTDLRAGSDQLPQVGSSPGHQPGRPVRPDKAVRAGPWGLAPGRVAAGGAFGPHDRAAAAVPSAVCETCSCARLNHPADQAD